MHAQHSTARDISSQFALSSHFDRRRQDMLSSGQPHAFTNDNDRIEPNKRQVLGGGCMLISLACVQLSHMRFACVQHVHRYQ